MNAKYANGQRVKIKYETNESISYEIGIVVDSDCVKMGKERRNTAKHNIQEACFYTIRLDKDNTLVYSIPEHQLEPVLYNCI